MTPVSPFLVREVSASHGVETPVSDLAEAARLELQAMQSIADAMASLPNERMRERVMAWVSEVFPGCQGRQPAPASAAHSVFGSSAPVTVRALTPPSAHVDEPALSLDGIEALFDDGRPSPGQFPPSVPDPRVKRRLSPKMVLRFRWWR